MSLETAQDTRITLAIESAIRGGSLSLFRGADEIDNWLGSADVSKAEELLVEIDAMLRRNALTIRDVDHVAVSAGPGSFTGIRIGIATALGLKAGLDITMSTVSALEAVAHTCNTENQATIALPVGRNAICVQTFSADKIAIDTPRPVSFEEFAARADGKLLLHSSLIEQFGQHEAAIDLGQNVATAIGQFCIKHPGSMTEPLFISKTF